jgi:Prp8 binding protein
LASAGFERKIFLWNVYGECENWALLVGHNGAILDLKYNNDGRY